MCLQVSLMCGDAFAFLVQSVCVYVPVHECFECLPMMCLLLGMCVSFNFLICVCVCTFVCVSVSKFL